MIDGLSVPVQIGTDSPCSGALTQANLETIITNYGDVATYSRSVILPRSALSALPDKDTPVKITVGLQPETFYVVGCREYDLISVIVDLRK